MGESSGGRNLGVVFWVCSKDRRRESTDRSEGGDVKGARLEAPPPPQKWGGVRTDEWLGVQSRAEGGYAKPASCITRVTKVFKQNFVIFRQ